ncbi:GNAT family N-acetyltransferase [Gryllotalpicola koreensis]|uniref:GNAT family protein n=1 Tax=Gryllotalpicola koreensis TaxID=993086 RepID=A0ABP8A8T1_9MICO
MNTFAQPLQTSRLVMRPVEPADAAAFLSWRSRPDVMRFMYQEPWTPETAEAKLAEWSATRELAKTGDAVQFAVARRRHPETLIGELMLKRAEGEAQAEIGWTLDPAAQGRGYATEAAGALLNLAFGELGFHRAFARLDEENLPSVRLCVRLGMRLEARHIENDRRPADGVWSTELVYAVLASEFAQSADSLRV